ncbi:hypothetical protein [Streptomyces sp. NRRL B-1347]|uniref:hypothetical protein n=1 Tax=Streptomyces sp. NRRL B-1347 TaxID=1476877 RepID=UPI00068DAE61|nr:hypothetical protein [Streptomyces sp. NRRL B-1347]
MSDLRGLLDPVGHGLLIRTLARCEDDEVTGDVRVLGRPGGVFRLSRGRVVAADSPGAPGLEVLLLRSGRLSDREWTDALAGGAAPACPGAALVARGIIGAAELQVISVMALRDAVFAMLAGEVTECATAAAGPGPGPAAGDGEEPAPLLREAARRLAALTTLSPAVLPDRHRLVPASGTGARADGLSAVRREILFLADGRRTPRDIAFMAGRGVYTVTVEASRMLGEGLLVRARTGAAVGGPGATGPQAPPLARRAAGERAGPPDGDVRTAGTAADEADEASALPRRSPGASGRTGTLAGAEPAASWKGLLRWGGRGRPADSGD